MCSHYCPDSVLNSGCSQCLSDGGCTPKFKPIEDIAVAVRSDAFFCFLAFSSRALLRRIESHELYTVDILYKVLRSDFDLDAMQCIRYFPAR